MQSLLALIALVAVCLTFAFLHFRLLKVNAELMRLLASRNFTEYSIGEARMAKGQPEQKTQDYGDAWDYEETNGRKDQS